MNTKKQHTAKEVIASRNHPAIKRIRNLHLRAERDRTKRFYIEGLRFVAEAVERHVHLETLVYSTPLLTHLFGQRLVRQQRRAGTPCLEVTPEVLQSIALNDDPQGIGAIVRQRWEPLRQADPSRGLCWIALETVQSPGNLGTIVRTADAVGAAGIILIGDATDAYNPATVRASMGALFSQHFVRATMQEFLAWKRRHGCRLVGTSPSATVEYDAVDYQTPLILFMGWERKGLTPEQQAACDVMVSIPMLGRSDSLNLAVATGVVLYEVLRQRRHS